MGDRKKTWQSRTSKIIARVNNVFPEPDEFENWSLCETLLLDASAACKQVDKFRIETRVAAILLNKTATYLHEKGKLEKAEPLFQRGLLIYEKVLGKEHTDVATTLNNLAVLYDDQGRYEKTESLYKQALLIYEKKTK